MTNNSPLGKLIVNGRTADIYVWEAGTVVKLFHDWFKLENVENEARHARAVHVAGLAVPKVGEIIPEVEAWLLAEAQKLEDMG